MKNLHTPYNLSKQDKISDKTEMHYWVNLLFIYFFGWVKYLHLSSEVKLMSIYPETTMTTSCIYRVSD